MAADGSRLAPAGAAEALPRWEGRGHAAALRRDPYRFIARGVEATGSDAFVVRLLLRDTVCLHGAEAVGLFLDAQRFRRAGAAPEPLRATLFGKGTVQGLDGARHRMRKALFVQALRPAALDELVDTVRRDWRTALHGWCRAGEVALYPALQGLLTPAVCEWAGIPLARGEAERRTGQLAALFDDPLGGPWRHVDARLARWASERWLAELVEAVRRRQLVVPPGSALALAARHVDGDRGTPLPPRVAAAELLNLLRPVVACSVWMVFVAHALHAHPAWAVQFAEAPAGETERAFAQEVRRRYPFFPAVAARVARPFAWRGLQFPAGLRALLDIHGTHHDARWWPDPQRFDPARFAHGGRAVVRGAFLPQGAGSTEAGHHCPGDETALRLMELAIEMFARRLRYTVPAQDLALPMDRLPPMPASGLVIQELRPA